MLVGVHTSPSVPQRGQQAYFLLDYFAPAGPGIALVRPYMLLPLGRWRKTAMKGDCGTHIGGRGGTRCRALCKATTNNGG